MCRLRPLIARGTLGSPDGRIRECLRSVAAIEAARALRRQAARPGRPARQARGPRSRVERASIMPKNWRNRWTRGLNSSSSGSFSARPEIRSSTARVGSSSRRLRSFRIRRNNIQTSGLSTKELAPFPRPMQLSYHTPGQELPEVHADVAPRDPKPDSELLGGPVGARDVEQCEELSHRGIDAPGARHHRPMLHEFADELIGVWVGTLMLGSGHRLIHKASLPGCWG